MSKIALEGNASGTGTLTIASQNTNSNYTLTLPNSTGTLVVTGGAQTIEFAAGTASAPSITFTGDTNTGIFSPTADTIAFTEGGAEAMRIDSSGNVLVGTTSSSVWNGASGTKFVVGGANNTITSLQSSSTSTNQGAIYEAYATGITSGDPGLGSIAFLRSNTSTTALSSYAAIYTNNAGTIAEHMRIDSSGNVGIGTSSVTSSRVQIKGANNTTTAYADGLKVTSNNETVICNYSWAGIDANDSLRLATAGTERARITSTGTLLIGKTTEDFSVAGVQLFGGTTNKGLTEITTSGVQPLTIRRNTNDGGLILFFQDSTQEGDISVSGTTVSYNGGHLSRYAQTQGPKDDTLVKGTVLSNLDEMNVYVAPTTYWTEEDELPEGVSVGDIKVETHTVENEQLNKVKVSDVEGDVNVAGVFVNWSYDEAHQVDEINMAMTGDMIIRIAQGVVVQKGDLLMSAGDGTAKPQGDDIVRSKTVAKVTSNHVTCTYADGSYCVPCVLMAC